LITTGIYIFIIFHFTEGALNPREPLLGNKRPPFILIPLGGRFFPSRIGGRGKLIQSAHFTIPLAITLVLLA
jgi:hypothetical protein